ncbi:MAG: glycoside hydrolase family 27 protein [Dinghuibacter sp.]|nr:glycoside hydrolase family 27 protein [Dinghuibacter sp.]
MMHSCSGIKKALLLAAFQVLHCMLPAQTLPPATPPMGFMTWNFFAEQITEADIRSVADALVSNGLRDAGYNYIFIDDGWQGGRDNKNNMIPDPVKFPSGMKALCTYVHDKGLKMGIYSDAAPLTCGGYTASLHFEEQDAQTFADWGFDYLKYDYCGAPADWQTAAQRYSVMAEALKKTKRPMVFSVCEWGDREPWLWAKKSGGHLWRTTADIRDKWVSKTPPGKPSDLHRLGAGILDVLNINADLGVYAGKGYWNDADMLVVGLYGKKGPSGALGGTGCTDVEYQSQMSLWCLMAAPLMVSCDVRNMNEATKRILLNRAAIAINQDSLGIQATRKIINATTQVFIKPLANGDIALGVLNTSNKTENIQLNLPALAVPKKKKITDVWSGSTQAYQEQLSISPAAHETLLYRISN